MSRRIFSTVRAKRSARQQWEAFKRSRPGERFQQYHERQQTARKEGKSWWGRPLRWTLAAVSVAIGVVLTVVPGPAVLFFAIAGGLMAHDSRTVARAVDGCEVMLRAIVAPLLRKWRSFRR